MINNCWQCKNSRSIPGDCHLQCVKPDFKMTAYKHGILKGWFFYPWNFDPVWMTKKCSNFEAKN